jgi:WD40 repeat protein
VVPAIDTRRELVRALVAAGLDADAADALRTRQASLGATVSKLAATHPGIDKVLVLLDQAEELVDHDDRVDVMMELADAALARSACRVVLTVREGFAARLLRGLDLDGRVWSFPVTPMSRAALAAAVEGPARRADLRLEHGLVQEVLDDVETGEALPLLALALERTYRSAVNDGVRLLTVERYRSSGRVADAVARQAGEAVARLGADGERRVVDVLARMVTVDSDGNWMRRTVERGLFSDAEWQVVVALAQVRLVILRGEDSAATATVVHSSLFAAWPPLSRALNELSDDLRGQQRLEREATDWDHDGRPADLLPRGSRYRQIVQLRRRHPETLLGQPTQDFLIAADREARRSRVRIVTGIAAIFLLLGLVAVFALRQLQEQARTSEAERVSAARQEIARALKEPRFDRAMDVALDALRRDPSRDAAEAVLGIVLREPAFRGYLAPATPHAGRALAWTQDHGLVTADSHGRIATYDRLGTEREELATADGAFVDAVDTSGSWSAAGDLDGRIRVWSTPGGRPVELRKPDSTLAHAGSVSGLIAVGATGLLSSGRDGDVALWDVVSGHTRWRVGAGAEVSALAAASDATAVAGTGTGYVVTIDLDDGEIRVIGRVEGTVPAIAAVGSSVFVGDGDGGVWRFGLGDASAEAPPDGPIHQGQLPVQVIEPIDAEHVLTGWTDGVVRLLDGSGHVLDEFAAHDESIRDVAVDRSTGWFAATGDDGLVSRWELDGRTPLVHTTAAATGDLVGDATAGGDVFLAGATGELSVLLGADGSTVRVVSDDLGAPASRIDVSDDGETVALGLPDRSVAVDANTGARIAEAMPGGTSLRVAISGRELVSAGDDLVITDLDGGSERRLPIPGDVEVTALAVDPVSETIVVGGGSGDVRGVILMWKGAAAEPVRADVGQAGVVVSALDIEPGGDRVIVGRNDGRIELWHLANLTPTNVTFTSHDREITDVKFAPSSSSIASLDASGVLWVWSSDFGTSFAEPIITGLEYARRVTISPDGTRLFAVGRWGAVTIPIDARLIEQVGCRLAALECGAPAPDGLSPLGG